MKNLIAAAALFCLSVGAYAQDKEPAVTPQFSLLATTTPAYKISGTDTAFTNSYIMAPVVGLQLKNGLGIKYSPYYITGNQSGIFMHALTAFYEQYGKPDFNIDAAYTHFIFTNNTSVPYSPLTNEIYVMGSYKKTWLNPVLSSGFAFGVDQNNNAVSDFSAAVGITHSFSRSNDQSDFEMEIAPSVLLNAGTNKYYSFLTTTKYIAQSKKFLNYTKRKNAKKKGNSANGSSGSTTTVTTNTAQNESFHISNLELNLYSSFSWGKFKIVPSGSVFLPLTNTADNAVSGYWQLSIGYGF